MEWFKTRYRIVYNEHELYEAQCRFWWCPFWRYVPGTFGINLEEAEERLIARLKAEARRARTVKYLGRLS